PDGHERALPRRRERQWHDHCHGCHNRQIRRRSRAASLTIVRNKYNFAARAALLALALTAGFALNTTAIAQAPPGSLWYNGDFNGVNGLANERNTIVTQAAVYDDFNVTAPLGWHVTAVFSDNLMSTTITGADWEIRTGLSAGNAGTLIASG